MPIPLDYEILRLIWWVLLGVLLIGFAVMDGFDLGVGALLPVVAKNEEEKRILINSIGPVWDGNQVWLLLGAGAIFAAWPMVYAMAFSGFYVAMLLALLALILRPVGFEFRKKMPGKRWRQVWDSCLFVAGVVPPIIFGVAFGNLFQGVPYRLDDMMMPIYEGGFFALLNPLGLLCGVISLLMLVMHGGFYLSIKTEGDLQQRAKRAALVAGSLFVVLFCVAGYWVSFHVEGYAVASAVDHHAASNPLVKIVNSGASWLQNFEAHPWLFLVPFAVVSATLKGLVFSAMGRPVCAFVSSAVALAATIATAGVTLFPFFVPSSSNPSHSLMVWDASSSQLTLFWMLLAVVFFVPLIVAYTSWVYAILRGKVTKAYLKEHGDMLY